MEMTLKSTQKHEKLRGKKMYSYEMTTKKIVFLHKHL